MPTRTPALRATQLPTQTTLPKAVLDLLQHSKRPNTISAYKSDLHAFGGWCAKRGRSPLPASPETVAEYLADRAEDLAPRTLQRHLASIGQAHKFAGLPTPTSSELVRTCLQGIRRKGALGKATPRKGRKGKAPALWATQVRQIASDIPNSGAGLRDRALLVLGFVGALRRSDLANLKWSQVEWKPEGVLLNLQASKTDTNYEGQQVAINSEPNTFCPITALTAWRAWCINHGGLVAQDLQSGAVFRSLNKHQQLGASLSAHAVGQIIKARATEAGLVGVTAHSLRRGHISEAHLKGRAEADIMHTSRHKSVAVFRGYIQGADPFGRATGKGLL